EFEHAYAAMLQLCIIPLRVAGYQVRKGESHHKKAIESLRYTLGELWGKTADYIDLCSRQRAQATCERIDVVSNEDADELLSKAQQLRAEVVRWLKASHADLVPPGI